MKELRKPQIRLAGFTDDWEQRKLGEVLKIKSGMSQKGIEIENGIYPILATGGEIGRTNTALYNKESVLIGRKGTIDKPFYMNTPFWTVDTLFYSELSSYVTGQFIYTLFQKIKWRNFDTSTGVPSLTSSTIHNIEVKIPSLPEQTAIGNFFKQLDETIALHQRECEKYQNLKKSYLDKMFPKGNELFPELRFPEFTDAWEQRKLGEIADIRRGASPRPIQNPIWFDKHSDIGWLRISDVTEQNGKIYKLEQKLSKQGQKHTLVLMEPHLILSIAATVGKPVINYIPTGIHDGFIVFLNLDADIEFLYQWLGHFQENWKNLGQSGSQVNINSDLVRNLEIALPSKQEQTAIGNFFKQLDETIALHQRELEKYKQIKQSYLEKMFI